LSQLLSKVTVAVLTSNFKCVSLTVGRRILKMCCYRSRHVFNCWFQDTDISHGSVATHLRCGGIFNDGIITNVLLILTVK